VGITAGSREVTGRKSLGQDRIMQIIIIMRQTQELVG